MKRTITLFLAAALFICAAMPVKTEGVRTVNTVWDFESQEEFDSWRLIDSDGDDRNWHWVHRAPDAEWWLSPKQGTGAAYSESFIYNESGFGGFEIQPDNYMISPEFSGATYISFWMRASDTDEFYDDDPVGVYVIDEDGAWSRELGYFTTWYAWEQHIIDLTEFEGRTVRVAFRHYNTTEMGLAVILDLVETDGIAAADAVVGDVDGNGSIDQIDAMLVARFMLGIASLTEEQLLAADVNRDGNVDLLDSSLIIRYCLGLITEF